LLDIDVIPTGPVASYIYGGKYYLAFESNILMIERFYESWSLIKGVNVRQFQHIWNEHGFWLAMCTEDGEKLYQVASALQKGTWESDWFALTYASGVQYLKQVLIKTAHPITLVLQNTRSTQKIAVNGGADVQKINVNLKGEMFKIGFETENDVDISALTAVVGFGNAN
jgi:hypothetical protein